MPACLYTLVHEYGIHSLNPSTIQGDVHRASQILREIVLAEHAIGIHYYEQLVKEQKSVRQLQHVSESKYVNDEITKIDSCLNPMLLENDIKLLVEDVYLEGDSDKLFGFPDDDHNIDLPPKDLPPKDLPPKDFPWEVLPYITQILEENFPKLVISMATAIVIVDSEYTYYGHVYVWPSESLDTADVIGIRTSLSNLVCRHLSNVAQKIFYGVALWCSKNGFVKINVISPLPVMQHILTKKLGFTLLDRDAISELENALINLQRLEPIQPRYISYGIEYFNMTNFILNTHNYYHDINHIAEIMRIDKRKITPIIGYYTRTDPFFWYRSPPSIINKINYGLSTVDLMEY